MRSQGTSPRPEGATIWCLLLQPTTSHFLPSHPLLTPSLPSPPPSACRHVQKPRAVETSWVSRPQCPAPVPTWVHHQCPVGERKSVPSQARGPSVNPPGPLGQPPTPSLDQQHHHKVYPLVPISGMRVRERHWVWEGGARAREGPRDKSRVRGYCRQGFDWGPGDSRELAAGTNVHAPGLIPGFLALSFLPLSLSWN